MDVRLLVIFFLDVLPSTSSLLFFFFNHTATTEIYTLSLHDALPIPGAPAVNGPKRFFFYSLYESDRTGAPIAVDRKSTRLNSSHQIISYAVFCLKKKKKITVIPKNTLLTEEQQILAQNNQETSLACY